MKTQRIFISRELSWLDFNSRVLDEALDGENPPFERLKFLAIFSSNLDEFFMVRVAGLRQQLNNKVAATDPAGLTPKQQLGQIRKKTLPLVEKQYQCLTETLVPELAKHNIRILKCQQLSASQQDAMEQYFSKNILPVLTPVAVDPTHPFPILNNGSIEIAVTLSQANSSKPLHAFVEVPQVLPRFVKLPGGKHDEQAGYVLLEDLIHSNIQRLFFNCKVHETCLFRIIRDMDFAIEEAAADFLQQIEKTLLGRIRRKVIRLELPSGHSGRLAKWLTAKLDLSADLVYKVDGPLDLTALFTLIELESNPALVEHPWPPCDIPQISDKVPVFDSIRKEGSIPNFLPYQKMTPVVRFLEEAAQDPQVLAIKQTLYRVSGDSPIVNALQRAAENKKQVTVIVELKARFDEEKNIAWARKLEESGAHVIYGIAGLKIHCKALLVIRQEEGTIQRYLHLGTGNYNDKTAKVYTDVGLFTNDPQICTGIGSLFNLMTGYSQFEESQRLASAPFNLRQTFLNLIEREIRLTSPHRPGHILAKMNSLVDPGIIEALYNAARAGVKVDLIVRGICCLKPGVGTKNIRVISIVDRFLEHTRVYYFHNGGEPEYYLSSADWMPRNLDRRIELLFPVDNENIKSQLGHTLKLQLADKHKGRELKSDGCYHSRRNSKSASSRSQLKTYNYFKTQASNLAQTPQDMVIFQTGKKHKG
jgi:polyphosphate kinase